MCCIVIGRQSTYYGAIPGQHRITNRKKQYAAPASTCVPYPTGIQFYLPDQPAKIPFPHDC
jgi:hypothetical protein